MNLLKVVKLREAKCFHVKCFHSNFHPVADSDNDLQATIYYILYDGTVRFWNILFCRFLLTHLCILVAIENSVVHFIIIPDVSI